MKKNYVIPIEMKEVDSSTFSAITWTPIGVAMEGACFIIRISNDTTKDVYISYDGVNAHDFLHSYTDMTLNFQSNSSPQGNVAMLKKGSLIYFQSAAGTGYVYVSGFYNE